MNRRALLLTVTLAFGCIWGPRPQLPGRESDAGFNSGATNADAAADSATAMPPWNSPDASADPPSRGDAGGGARDAVADRRCVDGDAGDGGDAGDAPDVGDTGHPCQGDDAARPATDLEVAP